jgi:hypothetical protein
MPFGQGNGVNQIVTALGLYQSIVNAAPVQPED